MSTLNSDQCPLCQQTNHCTGNDQCWCMQATIPADLISKIPRAYRASHCLCQQCIEQHRVPFSDAANNLP